MYYDLQKLKNKVNCYFSVYLITVLLLIFLFHNSFSTHIHSHSETLCVVVDFLLENIKNKSSSVLLLRITLYFPKVICHKVKWKFKFDSLFPISSMSTTSLQSYYRKESLSKLFQCLSR